MDWRRWRISRRGKFWMLMAASALGLALPPTVSNRIKDVAQLLVPFEDQLSKGAHWAGDRLRRTTVSQQTLALQRENDGLRARLGAQSIELRRLADENERLRTLRGRYALTQSGLLPARVVAQDIVAWRDAVLLDRGAARGAGMADWVASRLFLDVGRNGGADEGHAAFAQEVLLGRIEQVSPYMSRLQLFSDIDSRPVEVRIGSVESDGRTEFVEYVCSLRGQGRGRMVIEHVPQKHIQTTAEPDPVDPARRIRVGDRVFCAPGQFGLPMPMLIGRVASFEEVPKERLVWNVVIEPGLGREEVRDVLIISAVPTSGN